jgi:hypothetical protein
LIVVNPLDRFGKQRRDAEHVHVRQALLRRQRDAVRDRDGIDGRLAQALDRWTRRVLGASVAAPDGKGSIQDNRELPGILEELEQLFGGGSPVALIVQAVMLHQSLNVLKLLIKRLLCVKH